MFSGELRRVIFEYNGPSIESVLDRLPTAEILSEQNNLLYVTFRAQKYRNVNPDKKIYIVDDPVQIHGEQYFYIPNFKDL